MLILSKFPSKGVLTLSGLHCIVKLKKIIDLQRGKITQDSVLITDLPLILILSVYTDFFTFRI